MVSFHGASKLAPPKAAGVEIEWDDPLRDPTLLEWIDQILHGVFVRRNRIPAKLRLPVMMYVELEREIAAKFTIVNDPGPRAMHIQERMKYNTPYGPLTIERTYDTEPDWEFK
jgi:hypothetical protein